MGTQHGRVSFPIPWAIQPDRNQRDPMPGWSAQELLGLRQDLLGEAHEATAHGLGE